MIARALIDYYRCPEEFMKMTLAAELLPGAGYFGFGDNVCFGQTAYGYRASAPSGLYDTLRDVNTAGGYVRVPFDPTQVIDNLRLERYAGEQNGSAPPRETMWQGPYYALRPLIPTALRRSLQRLYMRGWKQVAFPRWPIDDTVDAIVERLLLLCLQSQGVDRVPFIWF